MTSQQRRTWWASVFGISMLLAAVGCVMGLLAWLIVPFTPFYANYIPEVRGKLELLASAEWHPTGAMLSPGGRYILTSWQRDSGKESIIWDRETDNIVHRILRSDGICWLNGEQFVAFDAGTSKYYLTQVFSGSVLPIISASKRWEQPSSERLKTIKRRLSLASQVYVINGVDNASTILTKEQDIYYVYALGLSGKDNADILSDLTRNLPYNICNAFASNINEGDKISSPTHPWYARMEHADVTHLRIRDANDVVLAEVGKPGWHPALLGWAHDGSGVYVQFVAQGEAAGITMPYRPIFKLSPYTPEEERQAQLERIAWWAGGVTAGVAAIGGVVWWRKRARRKQRVP